MAPDALALLQYTSGSTAAPKGVMVSQANLAANVSGIAATLGSEPGEAATSWLPLFHDMGLIGMLAHPVWAGMAVHLMPPSAFLRRPLSWLETISRSRSAMTMAPDFAYALAARRVRPEEAAALDLSGLRHAVTAAEPIRARTVEAFRSVFAPAGLRPEAVTPGYGLAENTLSVSWADPSAEPLLVTLPETGRQVVPCGSEPVVGNTLAIVDPGTLRRCPPGETGEIWVTGSSVTLGYWRRPEETAQAFRPGPDGEPGTWLRTGDLGVLADGALCVVGRLKDTVKHKGVTLHLHDLEQTALDCTPSLGDGSAAAFAVPGGEDGPPLVVLVHEVARPPADPQALLGRIRAAIAEEHGLALGAVALVRRGAVPRTTSGKVQRRRCADRWLSGELKPIASWTKTSGSK